jgi:hypothetical protein
VRALTSLNLASNRIGELILPVGWEKKSEGNDGHAPWFYEHVDGTKQDNNPGKPEGAIALANAIPDMGGILKFTFSGDGGRDGGYRKSITMETTMTAADFSGRGLGTSGAIMLSAYLPKCT